MAYDFSKLKTAIKEVEEHLARELAGVRTGRATPAILDSVRVEAYGVMSPLVEIGSVAVEDARTLRIVPWDKSLTKAIEKGITDADLGLGIATDEAGLRVTFPDLTGERRLQLTRLAGEKLEEARVRLRSSRTDALKEIEAAEKGGGMGEDESKRLKAEVQKSIDAANDSLAALAKKKEVEISQ